LAASAAAEVQLFCRYERAQLAFADSKRLGAAHSGDEGGLLLQADSPRAVAQARAAAVRRLSAVASDAAVSLGLGAQDLALLAPPLDGPLAVGAAFAAQADEGVRRRVLVRALLRLAQWSSASDDVENGRDHGSSSIRLSAPDEVHLGGPLLALATRVAPTSAKAWRRLGDWSLAQARRAQQAQQQQVQPDAAAHRVSVEAWMAEAATAYGACLAASTAGGEGSSGSLSDGLSSEGVGGSAAAMGVCLRLLELLDELPAGAEPIEPTTTWEPPDAAGSGGLAAALASCSASAPLGPWLAVLPQLLARLNHPHVGVAAAVHAILLRLAAAAPRALVLQVVVGVFETQPQPSVRGGSPGASALLARYLSLRAALASEGPADQSSRVSGSGGFTDRALLVAEHEVSGRLRDVHVLHWSFGAPRA
jgi:hypothetical protein